MENFDSSVHGSLLDVMTGERYIVTVDKKFVIGRARSCDLVISKPYISLFHCVIKFENNKFFISDNGTYSGSFLNFVKLPNEKDNFVVLKNKDVVGFSNTNRLVSLYRFSYPSNLLNMLKIYAQKIIKALDKVMDK